MTTWRLRRVPFKFQLSDLTIFSVSTPLLVRSIRLIDGVPAAVRLVPPTDRVPEDAEGFFIHALPVAAELPTMSVVDGYLCYVQLQYQHCYIDLRSSFEQYQTKFSSKTRSTINRKLKKYSEHCGGTIVWKTYSSPEDIRAFLPLAREVSKKTYQERHLGAGIPDSEEFAREAAALAADQRVRAYLLFDGERPVSYLYCPVDDGVLAYAYLGYDPEYMKLSVGTVLQWLALEQLFTESRFQFFDFTEGESDHKRLFATHQTQCANIAFLRNSVRNRLLVRCHLLMGRLSKWLGNALDRYGLKSKVKAMLRFAGN